MKNKAELWRALLDGKEIISKGGSRVRMTQDGNTQTYDGAGWIDDAWTFTNPEDWSIYEEPKKPRKALAYRTSDGYLEYCIEGSKQQERFDASENWHRVPGFDIEEKTDSK